MSPYHDVVTSLTGNMTGALLLESVGGLLIAVVVSYVLYRFAKFIFNAMDHAEEYGEQSYRNRAYIRLMVTGLQAGLLKQVAENEKIDLTKEIEAIPTDGSNPLNNEIKERLMKDVKDFGI